MIVSSSDAALQLSRLALARTLSFGGGKLIGYVLLGTVAGLAGFMLGSLGAAWALFLRLLAAGLLLLMGLYALGLWRGPQQLESFTLKLWQPLLRPLRQLDLQRGSHQLLAGIGWGLIPCGMVYSAMALALASGGLLSGALIMFSFGLGTLPFVLSMAGLGASLTTLIQHRYWKRVAGILLIVLAVWTLQQALPA